MLKRSLSASSPGASTCCKKAKSNSNSNSLNDSNVSSSESITSPRAGPSQNTPRYTPHVQTDKYDNTTFIPRKTVTLYSPRKGYNNPPSRVSMQRVSPSNRFTALHVLQDTLDEMKLNPRVTNLQRNQVRGQIALLIERFPNLMSHIREYPNIRVQNTPTNIIRVMQAYVRPPPKNRLSNNYGLGKSGLIKQRAATKANMKRRMISGADDDVYLIHLPSISAETCVQDIPFYKVGDILSTSEPTYWHEYPLWSWTPSDRRFIPYCRISLRLPRSLVYPVMNRRIGSFSSACLRQNAGCEFSSFVLQGGLEMMVKAVRRSKQQRSKFTFYDVDLLN